MTIEQFIDARLQEDEVQARGAWKEGALRGDRWLIRKVQDDALFDGGIYVFDIDSPPHGETSQEKDGETAHIERHDPARVLRQAAALRAILTEHSGVDPCDSHDGVTMESKPCGTLLNLAAIWSEHTDFQPEWAE